MRTVVTVQLVLGLTALFGSSYWALNQYLGPTLEAEAQSAATSGAKALSAEALVAWEQMRNAQRGAVTALAQTRIIRTLGSEIDSSDRERAMKSALESGMATVGGVGMLALIAPEGRPLYGESAKALASLAGTRVALEGGTASRVESIDGKPFLVTSSAVGNEGAEVKAALVLATALDSSFLGRLTALAASTGRGALEVNGGITAHTFPPSEPADLGTLSSGHFAQVGANQYAVHARGLDDDAGPAATFLALSPLGGEGRSPIQAHLSLALLALGGAALVLVLLVMMLSPATAASAGRSIMDEMNETFETDGPQPQPLPMSALKFPEPGPPASLLREPTALELTPLPTAVAHPDIQFPDLPVADAGLAATFAKTTVPSHPAPTPAPRAIEAIPLSSAPPAPVFSKPSSPPAPAWPEPISSPAFDAIANAAMSSPPPPRGMTFPQGFGHEEENLPVPKDGFSPELKAAQRAAAQRAGSVPPKPAVMSSLPPHPGYDKDLPAPKGAMPAAAPAIALPPSQAPRPSLSAPSAAPRPSLSAPSLPPAIPLAGSAPKRSMSNPGMPAPIPLPSRSNSGSRGGPPPGPAPIPLPGRSVSSAGNKVANTSDLPKPADGAGHEQPRPFDEEHYRVVYNEFVASKARLGEAVDNITYEGFRMKLRTSEQALLDRHGCRAVRFQVLVKDKTVSLRPQLVR